MSGPYSIFSAYLASIILFEDNYHVLCEPYAYNRCLHFVLVWLKSAPALKSVFTVLCRQIARVWFKTSTRDFLVREILLEIVRIPRNIFYLNKPVWNTNLHHIILKRLLFIVEWIVYWPFKYVEIYLNFLFDFIILHIIWTKKYKFHQLRITMINQDNLYNKWNSVQLLDLYCGHKS